MARPLAPYDLWPILEPLLPPEPPKPKGGRPRTPDGPRRECVVRDARPHADWTDDELRAALARSGEW